MKGLIFGIISIALVLLGWISLHKDFDIEDQDLYFMLFQAYIGLTIFEAVVKVNRVRLPRSRTSPAIGPGSLLIGNKQRLK